MSLKPRSVTFEEKWDKIKEAIPLLLTTSPMTKEFHNMRFADIYALCTAYPESLAEKLYEKTRTILEHHVKDLCVKISGQQEGNLLSEYFKRWDQFSTGTKNIDRLYSYMNVYYAQRSQMKMEDITYEPIPAVPDRPLELGDLCLDIWQKEVIHTLKDRLAKLLLVCIKKDRTNQNPDPSTSTIRGAISSFIEVEVFKNESSIQLFEEVFLIHLVRETREFFSSESVELLQECNVSQYMEKVLCRLDEERHRAKKFLPPCSHERVEREVQNRMIGDHLSTLHREVPAMVSQENSKDLVNMYTLLKQVPDGLKCLIDNVKKHVKQKGLLEINNLKDENIPLQFVESLLQVHKKYMDMSRSLFDNNPNLVAAVDMALETAINCSTSSKSVCRSPELLAKYYDSLLKKSSKGVNENEVEDKLCQSLPIFNYIIDKDIFLKFYSRFFAKRLIHQLSHSKDCEESMINKLKQICGFEYTSKLHIMFTDISLSAEHNEKFQEFTSTSRIKLGLNFFINVLQW